MESTFMSLLKGDLSEDDACVSLKSCVPVFIAYPEILNLSGKKISDVIQYYRSGVDYANPSTKVDIGVSEKLLLSMFNSVLGAVLNSNLYAKTEDELPKLRLNVDIGTSYTSYGIIAPNMDLVASGSKRNFFEGLDLKVNLAMRKHGELSERLMHNILLLQALRKKTNDGGVWR